MSLGTEDLNAIGQVLDIKLDEKLRPLMAKIEYLCEEVDGHSELLRGLKQLILKQGHSVSNLRARIETLEATVFG